MSDMFNINTFLKSCEKSAKDAFDSFQDILECLGEEENRLHALDILSQLQVYQEGLEDVSDDEFCVKYNFYFKNLEIEKNSILRLLQFPSVFSPEEWSYTFFEGICRLSQDEFSDKVIAELGTGNGWIPISLAKKWPLKKIYGLDINPKAIQCARINLYLNSFDSKGNSVDNIFERVQFEQSDLLGFCRENNILLDKVIGCIPQVLSPDPEKLMDIQGSSTTDEDLYALSNYCGIQGQVEDQFGLGLIARAIEESLNTLTSSGHIVFNLGGRPSTSVLTGLFERRGFSLNKIWGRRVIQAFDTDIKTLVEIERKTGHRFEFFMGMESKIPISATTAEAYAKAGGIITHGLGVYLAKAPLPKEMGKILNFLGQKDFQHAHEALDLSSTDSDIFKEKTKFLSVLVDILHKSGKMPYETTQGKNQLRINLASFIESYFNVPLSMDNIIIFPSRRDVISNTILLFRPKLSLIDQDLAKDIQVGDLNVLENPRNAEQTIELLNTLKPQLLVTSLAPFEIESREIFKRLLEETEKLGTRLILDISEFFDLSSNPISNGVFSYLTENPLPEHAMLICGLVKNRVYSDLKLCFGILKNDLFLKHLIGAAELTYSRTPLLTQDYYQKILDDLLDFQFNPSSKGLKENLNKKSNVATSKEEDYIPLCQKARLAFDHPAIKRIDLPIDESTVRLDYGENCLSIPTILKVGLFEAFSRRELPPEEVNPTPSIQTFLSKSLGVENVHKSMIFLGGGIAPLFSTLMRSFSSLNKTLIFPSGSYGEFMACAQFFGANIFSVKTSKIDDFKYTPSNLHEALKNVKNPVVFLNAPIINPTGSVYTRSELCEILKVIEAHKGAVILDTAFFALDYATDMQKGCFSKILDHGIEWAIMGSVSKLFAAGGLRFGFAASNSNWMKEAFSKNTGAYPHKTVQFAARKLFEAFNDKEASLVTELGEQRILLKKRAEELSRTLEETGWKVLSKKAGLFLVASPTSYLNKKFTTSKGKEIVFDSINIARVLLEETGLLINGSDWTGIPDHCRFVLSVTEDDFSKGIVALKSFWKSFDK